MKKIKKYLKKHLTKERYEHTRGVAYTAAALAMRYNPDIENETFVKRTYLAGMLHDCAKCMKNEKRIRICMENNISISQVEIENPFLLHGKVGAYIAKKKFGIEDNDILNAIVWHTTGRPNMSLMEKIIFIADYIEPGRRPLPEINRIRQEAFTDIDKALVRILSNTLSYLNEKGDPVDDMTQKTYDSYVTAQVNKQITDGS